MWYAPGPEKSNNPRNFILTTLSANFSLDKSILTDSNSASSLATKLLFILNTRFFAKIFSFSEYANKTKS